METAEKCLQDPQGVPRKSGYVLQKKSHFSDRDQSWRRRIMHSRLSRTHAFDEQERPHSRRARHNSETERILFGSCGKWVNYYDRRSYCPRQRIRHVYYRPIIGRFTFGTLSGRIIRRTWNSHEWKKGQLTRDGNIINCKSGRLVPQSYRELLSTHVPETMQLQHREDRTPTALGDREKDRLDWHEPFTEGIGRRWIRIIWQCWCVDSQNTSSTFSSETFENNLKEDTICSFIFRRTP